MSASAAPSLPGMLRDNPRLDQWVRFDTQGRVTVSTGRVEIGQGVLTAMRQIAAEELDISPDRILLQTGDTELTPNEGYTAGSQSIQFGGVALRQACAEVRLLFLDRAAAQLGHQRDTLSVENGAILHKGQSTGQDYWSLAASVDLQREATGGAPIKQASQHRVVGQNLPRTDLADKVFGGPAFLHDVALDGMLHARVVRQPCRGATIRAIDEAAIRRAARGPIEIVRDGNFVAILGPDETLVEAAAATAPGHVAWDNVEALNPISEEGRWLLQQPSIDKTHGAPPTDPAPAGRAYEATYTRMHIAHASIGPSCGLALYQDGHLQVWTHCQGVYPLRAALARTLKLDPAAISVKHVQGPGCYGHNGADDAAADAPVTALRRPGPPPPGAGTRNGEPLYAFPAKRIVHHLIAETPVRTSSLRGLGATLNVYAIESSMDELAERAGQDPVAYRLSVLADPRARKVVEHVAQMAGWRAGLPAGTGKGRGIGFAQYKNMAAYAAVIAEVEVVHAVQMLRVWCSADAGLVINPDGAINQLEGGIVQGVSWALKEGVRLDESGISSRDWEGYPVLRFSEVPEIAVELVDPAVDRPPLGVGEPRGGPAVAAIGNAVAHALGARIRDLPMTRERVMAALLRS